MGKKIAVIYEHGVLRPLESLDFPEQSTFEIEIIAQEPEKTVKELSEMERSYNALIEAGLISYPRHPASVMPQPSESELARVAEKLSQYGPLSELIIQERENN